MNQEGEREKTTRTGLPYVLGIVVSILLAAVIVFFAVQTYRYAVPNYYLPLIMSSVTLVAVLLVIILVKKPLVTQIGVSVASIVLAASLIISMSTLPFTSRNRAYYNKQMKYLLKERYSTQFFPTVIPKEATAYKLEFSPEILQDHSYLCLEYCCQGKSIAEYIVSTRKKAILSPMDLEEARAAELDEKHKAELFEMWDEVPDDQEHYGLQIHYPSDIEMHPHATVFVMSVGTDSKHPHTEVILIDIEKGWICFCKTDGYV